MRDAYVEHMEHRAGVFTSRKAIGWRNGHDYSALWRERPEQDPFQALLAAAYSVYLTTTVAQIVERKP